jgi:pyrroloquinoline-quinone synthase
MSNLQPTTFREELFAVVRQETFRDAMFDAIRSGQVTRAGLKAWTLQASLIVRPFTQFISAIHANCPHRDAQALLAENLWEEHGKGNAVRDHYALICRLAKSFGATDEEVEMAAPLAATTEYVKYCFRITREASFIEGMSAIGIGIEYFIPHFFGTIAESFRKHYGLSNEEVEYLLIHVGEDEDHAERSFELIERYADSYELRDKAKQALRDMLRVKRRFAEALYEFCSNLS